MNSTLKNWWFWLVGCSRARHSYKLVWDKECSRALEVCRWCRTYRLPKGDRR